MLRWLFGKREPKREVILLVKKEWGQGALIVHAYPSDSGWVAYRSPSWLVVLLADGTTLGDSYVLGWLPHRGWGKGVAEADQDAVE